MKANELMVGDWVRIKLTQHNTTVTNIDANSVYTEAAFPIRYDEIEPIPLTPEILEKNGFTYIIVLGEVAPKLENFELDNHWEGDGYSWNDIPLLYVHQLQHALRLCGIEKEIML